MSELLGYQIEPASVSRPYYTAPGAQPQPSCYAIVNGISAKLKQVTVLLSNRLYEYINFKTGSMSMGKFSSVSPSFFNFCNVIVLW